MYNYDFITKISSATVGLSMLAAVSTTPMLTLQNPDLMHSQQQKVLRNPGMLKSLWHLYQWEGPIRAWLQQDAVLMSVLPYMQNTTLIPIPKVWHVLLCRSGSSRYHELFKARQIFLLGKYTSSPSTKKETWSPLSSIHLHSSPKNMCPEKIQFFSAVGQILCES